MNRFGIVTVDEDVCGTWDEVFCSSVLFETCPEQLSWYHLWALFRYLIQISHVSVAQRGEVIFPRAQGQETQPGLLWRSGVGEVGQGRRLLSGD